MQNCSIRLGTYESSPGLMIETVENVTKIFGFEGDLFNEIAKQLNFHLNITVVVYTEIFLYENGTATGIIEQVLNNEFDIIMSLLSSTHLRSVFMTQTKSYFIDRIILITPANEYLDPVRKLFYVFDSTLWITLSTTWLIILTFLQIIRLSYPRSYPREFRNPILSLLIAIVGGSEINLPRRNVHRIMFGSILVFCLIIRSTYQGALFNIIKKDVLINEIKTIRDANLLRLTFFMIPGTESKVKELGILER